MTTHDSLNIDDLLDDLQDITAPTPQKPTFGSNAGIQSRISRPFSGSGDSQNDYQRSSNVLHPHPPKEGKSPSQTAVFNPKNRFAVMPDGQKTSPTLKSNPAYSNHPNNNCSSVTNTATVVDTLTAASATELSLDNWLDSLHLSPKPVDGAASSASPTHAASPGKSSTSGFHLSSPSQQQNHQPNVFTRTSPTPTSLTFSPDLARNGQQAYQNFGLATKLATTDSSYQAGSHAIGSTSSASKTRSTEGDVDDILDNSWDEDAPHNNGLPRTKSASSSSFYSKPSINGGGINSSSAYGGFGSASNNSAANSRPNSLSLSNMTNAAAGTKARCSRVMLGGASASRGLRQSAFSSSVCDALLCSQCNFKVLCFPQNQAWQDSVDYLFVRNNMPRAEKLSVRLQKEVGSAAYCCQCNWASVKDVDGERLLTIGASGDPQWLCAGHTSSG